MLLKDWSSGKNGSYLFVVQFFHNKKFEVKKL